MVYIIVFGNFLGYHYVDSLVIIFISTVLLLIPAAMLMGLLTVYIKFLLLLDWPKAPNQPLCYFVILLIKGLEPLGGKGLKYTTH